MKKKSRQNVSKSTEIKIKKKTTKNQIHSLDSAKQGNFLEQMASELGIRFWELEELEEGI